jgi:RHS repeat-associated protein
VSSTYYANGLLHTETERLRTRADTTAGGDFTHHVYTTSYEYDLAGRRTTLTVPEQLAPRIQPDTLSAALLLTGTTRQITDQIHYTYDTGSEGTGWLTRIDGLLPSDVVRYGYTPRGEVAVTHLVMEAPDGPPARSLVESRTYDADGGLQTLQVRSDAGGADTLRDARFTHDAAGRVLTASDAAAYGLGITPTTATYHYSGLGALRLSDVETVSPFGTTELASSEALTYDALGNWHARQTAASAAVSVPGGGGFGVSAASSTARYTTGTGRLRAQDLGDSRADTLRYDAAGNLHAMLTTTAGSPAQWSERVSYYAVDGRLVAADARAVAFGGTANAGHAAFETYRYDALGRRVWAWAQRTCDDVQGFGGGADAVPCQSSTVRRTVWDGASELAEIQMPADSTTSATWVENDTLPVQRPVPGTGTAGYDANRRYGRVLYVQGLATDQPVAVTRVNDADATDDAVGSVPWAVYAPFSVVPLWDATGRADRGVVGGTAAPGQDAVCTTSQRTRCAVVSYDPGRFPYARAGADPGSWQGTLVVDKADATGTYYRRNRSYDPQTARWTQEDPAGLAGGLNLYGFAGGDPTSYADPFGLWPGWLDRLISRAEAYVRDPTNAALIVAGTELQNSLAQAADGAAEAAEADELAEDISVEAGLAVETTKGAPVAPKEGVPATGPQTRYIPQAVRNAAVEENPSRTCPFCKMPGTATTFDHAQPFSKGGSSTDIRNIQLACPHCNYSKGAGEFPKTPPSGYVGPWPPK